MNVSIGSMIQRFLVGQDDQILRKNPYIPPEYADEQKATTRVASAMVTAITHLFNEVHCRGSRGSLGIHSTRYGSSSVPEPSYL
jgi:hypothetical protein